MTLKKFKVRYCVSPERDERVDEVHCTDKCSAENIILHSVRELLPKAIVSIHKVEEILDE
jgi:hypothetical protein